MFFEESQQPTCPQVMQSRRCTHESPIARHSSHPSALGVTSRIEPRCVHCVAMSSRSKCTWLQSPALEGNVGAIGYPVRRRRSGVSPPDDSRSAFERTTVLSVRTATLATVTGFISRWDDALPNVLTGWRRSLGNAAHAAPAAPWLLVILARVAHAGDLAAITWDRSMWLSLDHPSGTPEADCCALGERWLTGPC